MKSENRIQFDSVDLSTRSLAIAALFEGEFYVDWVQELADIKTRQALTILEDAVQQSILLKVSPGCFSFKEKKKRKELMSLLDKDEIKELHQLIITMVQRETLDQKEAALKTFSHLLQIDNGIENCRLLFFAGEQFRKTFVHEKAMLCYKKVIRDMGNVENSEADWLYAEAVIGYSKISEVADNFDTVISVLKKAKKRAERRKNKIQQALLSMHLAKNEWLSSDYDKALNHFNQGLSLAEMVNDSRLKRATVAFKTFFTYWQGKLEDTIKIYEDYVLEDFTPDVTIFSKTRFPLLASEAVGVGYTAAGHVTQGMGMLDALLNHCRNCNETFVASYAGAYIASIMFEFGRYNEAMQYQNEALEFAKPYPNHLMKISLLILAAAIYFRRGEFEKSIQYFKRFLKKKLDPVILGIFSPYFLELCWAVEQGYLPKIRNFNQKEEIRRSVKYGNLLMKGVGYRYLALYEKNEKQPQKNIIKTLETSLENLDQSGHRLEQARTKVLLAREYLRVQQDDLAREFLQSILPEVDLYGDDLVPEDLRFLIKESRTDTDLLGEIMKLSQEIVSIRDNKELVSKIISTTNRLTNAERGAIFHRKDDTPGPGLELRASKNLVADDIIDPGFSSSMDLIHKAGESGEGLILTNDELFDSSDVGQNAVRSCIAVPMKLRDKVVGVLYHDNRMFSNTFQSSDLKLLEHFSAITAVTMDNIRSYEEIQNLYQRLREEKQYYEKQDLERHHFEDFVGKSKPIMKVFSGIAQVANTEANVLVLGETGVGKELVARAIHRNSSRRDKPFIRVNCSALPDTLVTSELFGHEKGAFTGAVDRKIGRFELADGGTLFMDEIGDISLDVQVKLLRVLQSKEFERLGGKTTIRSDFRLVTATNRDLKKMVREKTFRQDLFYRLNVFPIYIPALSERRDDIPLLVQHFLKIYSKKMGRETKKISEGDMKKLMNYEWPGNIRELENIIERGVILSMDNRFRLPELSESYPDGVDPKKFLSMDEMEQQHILQALETTNWKIRGEGGTSEILNMHPSTLYSRIKKLGIKKPAES